MTACALTLAIDVVADILGFPPSEVTAESDFAELGADQLAMTNIVIELEDRAKIELSGDLEDAVTVAELAAGVRHALAAAAVTKENAA